MYFLSFCAFCRLSATPRELLSPQALCASASLRLCVRPIRVPLASLCPVCLLSKKLFSVVFQVVPSCFRVVASGKGNRHLELAFFVPSAGRSPPSSPRARRRATASCHLSLFTRHCKVGAHSSLDCSKSVESASRARMLVALSGEMTLRPVLRSISIRAVFATPPPPAAT